MKQRFKTGVVVPGAYKAMIAFDATQAAFDIDPIDKELIKLRASQINGCGYCVDSHARDAIKAGATVQQVILTSAWRESGEVFTEAQRLIFAIVEEVTLIAHAGLTEPTYEKAIALFGQEKTAQIIMATVIINAWNRIGVSSHLQPAVETPATV
ncbi:AhpD family alkylhydroperoxidase [Chitinophaga skermanii]|uniref:AhpD family alkylhydroperoxidase n=1 Tax=Chitinophaga skermanii TaxID=331697 RepID=A0A327QEU5_9BACT|nr:carboxymuconolactone decarboxylase family protein [Chitinophaga skermanii]RAJ02398.1 AhpD family alkylhydroperoxidase [Chitinophaga skermanii]